MKVWIYWGLERDNTKTLLALFRHQPSINETDVFAKRSPHYDYLLGEYDVVDTYHVEPEIHNPKLTDKLVGIMPPDVLNPPPPKNFQESIRFQHYPIRRGAETFAHAVDYELPRNTEELRFLLWTFGEVMFREMERQVNESMKLVQDTMMMVVNPPLVVHRDSLKVSG